MQVVDKDGNVFGAGLEIIGPDGKPKTTGGGVTNVTATSPIVSTGGISPNISMPSANTSTNGYITSVDWNAFNGKQDTITLTTTGSSGPATLVGTTLNIPEYAGGSGGGLQGAQVQFNNNGNQPTFGFNAAITAGNTGSLIPTANRLDVYPIRPNKTLTNVSFTINTTTGIPNALARLVVYSNSNDFPTTKLFESTSIDCSTLGDKTVLTGLTFTAGTTYWIGSYTVGSATFRALPPNIMLPIFWPSLTTPSVAWSRINTTLGTAPTTFNYNTYSSGNQMHILIKPT